MRRIWNGTMEKCIFSSSLNPACFIISPEWFMCVQCTSTCSTTLFPNDGSQYFIFSWHSIVFTHSIIYSGHSSRDFFGRQKFFFFFDKIKSMRWISVHVSHFLWHGPTRCLSTVCEWMCLCLFEWRCAFWFSLFQRPLFPKLFHLLNSRRRRRWQVFSAYYFYGARRTCEAANERNINILAWNKCA